MKLPKRLRWWAHGQPTVLKTSSNGKVYIPRGKEREADFENQKTMARREFLGNAAKYAAAGMLGAGIASMGIPVGASPPINWNQGPGSMEEVSHFTIFLGGTSWYRRDGDTGKIGDSSENDPLTTDPVPLINRTISAMSVGHALYIKSGFTTATTINFTVNICYYHYGVHNYTGTGDAVYINTTTGATQNVTDPDTGAVIPQPSLRLYIYTLYGPNSVSPYTTNSTAYGIHAFNAVYPCITVDRIMYFAEAIRIDQGGTGTSYSGYNNIAVDGLYIIEHIRYCNMGIHFSASVATASGLTQTNKFIFDIEVCAGYGVLIDNLTTFNNNNAYQQFYGIIDNHGISGAFDYVNNQVQSDTNAGNILVGFFLTTSTLTPGSGSVVGPKDVVFSTATFSYVSPGIQDHLTKTIFGQTTTQTVLTYPFSNASTAQNNGTFKIGGTLSVVSVSGGTVTLQVTYHDSQGIARTFTIGTANATGDFPLPTVQIFGAKGTNLVITAVVAGTINYNATGSVKRIAGSNP